MEEPICYQILLGKGDNVVVTSPPIYALQDQEARCASYKADAFRAAIARTRALGSRDRLLDTQAVPVAPRAVITAMSAIKPKPIRWLWESWLARGKVHILGGHPGDGKSTLTAWLAAELSTGGVLPDGHRVPASNSLFLLAEDALDDTFRPRLDLHNANVDRVFAIEAVEEESGKQRTFNLARHIDAVRAVIVEQGVDLWVIDPLTAFMTNSDRNSEGDVRDLLTPVAKLAEETGVAVLCILHVGKPSGTQRRPLQQLLGATAFGAVGRVVWMVSETGGDESPSHRVLGIVKSNIGPKPSPLEWSRGMDGPVRWHGESSYDLDALLAGDRENKLDDAKKFVFETLKGGSVGAQAVTDQSKQHGIKESTLRRAKEALAVESYRVPHQKDGPWLWRLPSETIVEDAQPYRDQNERLPTFKDAQSPTVSTLDDSPQDARLGGDDHLLYGEGAQLKIYTNEPLPFAMPTTGRGSRRWSS